MIWYHVYLPLALLPLTAETHNIKACPKTYKKIGCYEDTNNDMIMLVNYRDSGKLTLHKLKHVFWKIFDETIHSLACECISKAKSKGFDYIQIGSNGECKGGRHFPMAIMRRKRVPSGQCIDTKFEECVISSKLDCVGKIDTGFIYLIDGDQERSNVNGGYSPWSAWSECSATCGEGIKERYRECNNPVPQGAGEDCFSMGEPEEINDCYLGNCQDVNAEYFHWSDWSECSATCGEGIQERERECNIHALKGAGKDCASLGQPYQLKYCYLGNCQGEADPF